jgi:DtxR family Mn-dependent transcriptional regulator
MRMYTQAVEDYLKTIYEIQIEQGKVGTTVVAEQLGVAPASVTGMLKRLADMRLVVYQPYQGVTLTGAGEKIALEVIRHHRLAELFLARALGVPWDQVHNEANKIEHVLSEDLVQRIDVALGHPATDPHGAPIPGPDGSIEQPDVIQLAHLKPGQVGVVAEVSDHNPAMLRYLGELGLYPRAEVHVLALAPFNGPVTIRVGDVEHTLGQEVARQILVTNISTERET